jgi:hypothetical protein
LNNSKENLTKKLKMLSEVYSSSIYISSLKPLFILSSLTGLFFIQIDLKTSTIVTPLWNRLIIIFVLSIQIFGNSFYLHHELMKDLFFTKVSKIGTPILMLSDYSGGNNYRRIGFFKIMRNLNTFR